MIPPNKLKHYHWFLNGIATRTQVKPHVKIKKMPTTMKTKAIENNMHLLVVERFFVYCFLQV
jgi:hypothetical protein